MTFSLFFCLIPDLCVGTAQGGAGETEVDTVPVRPRKGKKVKTEKINFFARFIQKMHTCMYGIEQ